MCHPDADTAGVEGASQVNTRMFDVETDGTALPVFEAAPQGESKGNVVIIHDIHGANDFYHDLARRFATVGYTAYLPDLFVRQGPLAQTTPEAVRARGGKLSYPQAIKDVGNLLDTLQAESSRKIAAVGFCMGGTLVMLLAAREPRFSVGVIYYGFPANPSLSENRPWEPMRETPDIQIPLLGFWGDQDKGVGIDNVTRYEKGLTHHEKTFDFTVYPGLPHGFLTFDPASPNYEASKDSWQKMIAFFGEQL